MRSIFTKMITIFRATIFYTGYALATCIWGLLSLIIAPFLTFPKRHKFINQWSRFVLLWLRICCGITVSVEGRENLPDQPCIVFSKHQSPWETFFLQVLFTPSVTVLKKELLQIPFFGWALKLLEPIVIDREQKRAALTEVANQGQINLEKGRWILIFPEGTRINSGENSKLAQGGFVLAEACQTQLLPIAHNAGEFWPSGKFGKNPGVVKVVIGKPIHSTNKKISETMADAAEWLNTTMHRISDIEAQRNTQIKARKVKEKKPEPE